MSEQWADRVDSMFSDDKQAGESFEAAPRLQAQWERAKGLGLDKRPHSEPRKIERPTRTDG